LIDVTRALFHLLKIKVAVVHVGLSLVLKQWKLQ